MYGDYDLRLVALSIAVAIIASYSSALAAKEMRGTITAHSDGLGKDAAFTLALPVNPG
jgi:NO-binding membrane sensor protein with MHYT domain